MIKAFLTAAVLSGLSAPLFAAEEPALTARWLVAHDREDSPFRDLMDGFSRRIKEKSGGKLMIEFVPIAGPDSQWGAVGREKVTAGEAEISQIAAGSVRSSDGADGDYGVLDMPFVFRDYGHAAAFFDSAVARRLLAGASTSSEGRLRAVDFTYSGGFRVLHGKKPLERASDLKGAKLSASRGGPIMAEFLTQAGAALVGDPEARTKVEDDFKAGRIDLEETEVNRLAIARAKHPELAKELTALNLTNHRMYMTVLIVNEAFLARLPEEQRVMLLEELKALAREERRTSIELEKRNLAKLEAEGVRVVRLSKGERAKLEKAGAAVLKKHPAFGAVVAEIRALKSARDGGMGR